MKVARGLSDTVIELRLFAKAKLILNAETLADPYFETYVIKIKSKQKASLFYVEKKEVRHLLENSLKSDNAKKTFEMLFAERVLTQMQTK